MSTEDKTIPFSKPKNLSSKKYRKRSLSDTDAAEDNNITSENDDFEFKLETTKLMQQLRASRTRGSDMVADVIGYTKSGDSTIGSLDQNFVSHDSSKNFMEKRMEEYIEHEMKKKKSKHSENGQPDNVIRTNSNSLDQKDMIMTRKDSTKESSVPGVNRSGIVEVELPDTYVLKSIEETKKAAQKLREDSKKVSDRSSDDILDVPANFNSDFKKHKSDFHVDLGSKATDDIFYNSFKKKFQR